MSDLTIYAEALISTVARAFYDDEVVCLIDVMIRDKFLRDDDMSPRLNLPAKKLRATLQFLIEEHLVRSETVDDLAQGGSQATKFYYIDYNRAVHSIRLRIYLLQKKLQQDELHARSQSFYLCPGYALRRCNGRYNEEESQQIVDLETGLFLCRECYAMFENDPNQPSKELYTLRLVDNTKELRTAMDNLRRVNVQLSSKFIGNEQLRVGIYDLLQKVRGGPNGNKLKTPITSNLPSENFALGIGSKRLAGTGRTAGIKEKKLLQQGMAQSAAQARSYLVGGANGTGDNDDNNNNGDDNDKNGDDGNGTGNRIHVMNKNMSAIENLLFLKNAMGHEIQFTIERGGAARAQLLVSSTKDKRRTRRKLLDAAASRVGSSLPIPLRVQLLQEAKLRDILKQKLKAQQFNRGGSGKISSLDDPNHKKSQLMKIGDTFYFLKDNIGRAKFEEKERYDREAAMAAAAAAEEEEEAAAIAAEQQAGGYADPSVVILTDDLEEMSKLSDEQRLAKFQGAYNIEIERQEALVLAEQQQQQQQNNNNNTNTFFAGSPYHPSSSLLLDYTETNNNNNGGYIIWEDGEIDY